MPLVRGDAIDQAITGVDAAAQGHLFGGAEVAVADQIVQQRVRDETCRDGDRVVRHARRRNAKSAIAHHTAHGAAVGDARQRHNVDHWVLGHARHAFECILDDADLERTLSLERRMLQIAAAAARRHVGTRRLDAPGRGFDHVTHFGGRVVTLGLDDLGRHHFVGQRPPHEHHPTVGVAGDGRAALGDAGRVQLRPIHHRILAVPVVDAR